MKNILVAVDRQKHAPKLLAQAVQLAKLSGGKIWIIHVAPSNPDDFLALESGPQYVYDKRAENRKREDAFVRETAARLIQDERILAEGLLLEGSIPKVIKKITEERAIDLVIAGHQRKNVLYDLFAANHKKDLIDDLNIPLLAVPLG